MKLLLTLILVPCWFQSTFQQSSQSDLSDYFRSKHVVNHGHVQRQLLSNKIPDDQKQKILQNYVGKSFNAQPNPSNPAGKKPWRAALGGKTGSTFILAGQKDISNAVKKGIVDGVDSKGHDVTRTKQNFPMINTKTKFGAEGTGSGPKKNINLSIVKNGNSIISNEPLRVSHFGGKINHFESANKIKPTGSVSSRSRLSPNRGISMMGRGKG